MNLFWLIKTGQIDRWRLISSLCLTAMIKYPSAAALWNHSIIKTKERRAPAARLAGRYPAKSMLHLRRFSRQSSPHLTTDQTSPITRRSAQLPAHTFPHRWVPSRGVSKQVSSAPCDRRARRYSHYSLTSSALTRRPVLPPSIMSGKLQFPHVSCRELWSALIEYSLYPPPHTFHPLLHPFLLLVETPSATN